MNHQEMVDNAGKVIAVIHLAVAVDNRETIACSTKLKYLGATATQPAPWLRSNDLRAVTCPMCRKRAGMSASVPDKSPAQERPQPVVTYRMEEVIVVTHRMVPLATLPEDKT